MQRALLVANPSASGFTGSRYRTVSGILRESYELETIWPESPAGSRKAAAAAAESGLDVVFAMGGDGVVHHVASGLIATDTSLGVVPAGTTNVLARILGLPNRADKAAALVGGARPIPLPTARVAWTTADGEQHRHALFSFGLGLDADIVEKAERFPHAKLRFGSLHYAATTVGTVVGDYRNRETSIQVSVGESMSRVVSLMIQVHHAYTYLGRIPLRLGSAVDGLAALACKDINVTRSLRIVGRATFGGRAAVPGCDLFENIAGLEGVAAPEAPAQADGEMLGPIGAFSVTYEPDALTVLAPHELRAS